MSPLRLFPSVKNHFLLPAALLLFVITPLQSQMAKGIDFDNAGRMAVAASTELQTQYAMLGIQQSAWKAGLRSYFPSVSFNAGEDDRLSVYSADSFQKNYSLSVEQLLFDGGQLLKSRKIEKEKISLSISQLKIAENEIYESAISSYRQILASREILEIRKRGLKSMEEQRKIMNVQYELGMSLASSLTEADINIADTKIEILNVQLELKNLESQFCELLGLNKMPLLAEKIDPLSSADLPDPFVVRSTVQSKNSELESARLSIMASEEGLKLSISSWLPTLTANGTFAVSGKEYPLTNYNWSMGLSLKFATPLLSSNLSGSYGKEGRYTTNARANASAQVLPEPARMFSVREARIALEQERSNYTTLVERTTRNAELVLEKCKYSDEKRIIALQTAELATERLKLEKLRFDLGEITGLELIEIQNELTQKEVNVVSSAIEVRNLERELERILNLQPGELTHFAKTNKNNKWRKL
jgi:outer membrane protein TolC